MKKKLKLKKRAQHSSLKMNKRSKLNLKAKEKDVSSTIGKKSVKASVDQKEQKKKLSQDTINRPWNANLTINDLIANAKRQNLEFENKKKWNEEETKPNSFTDKSAKAYYKEFKKVVEAADVILQVLDARDPQNSRCLAMEDLVRSYKDKRLVLILNKADLVPRSNLEEWIKYLKNFYPTLLFKASTQSQSNNIAHAQISKRFLAKENAYRTSRCVGADTLLQLLKNFSRNHGIKTAISVGVVGMPNVGKSSLINSLKRSKACNVGATPGVTKNLQEVILDSKVRLLDCPGVIMPGVNSSDAASSLRNALRIEDLADPISPVEAILEKAGADNLRKYYDLTSFSNVDEFLSKFAAQRNLVCKGGVPNIDAAARTILRDWNTGKITYYTSPPQDLYKGEVTEVSSLAEEFSLEDFDEMNAMEVPDEEPSMLPTKPPLDQAPPSLLPSGLHVDLSAHPEDEMCVDDEEEKKERWETEIPEIELPTLNLKKFQQKLKKKQRKERNRNVKRTDGLLDAFENLGN